MDSSAGMANSHLFCMNKKKQYLAGTQIWRQRRQSLSQDGWAKCLGFLTWFQCERDSSTCTSETSSRAVFDAAVASLTPPTDGVITFFHFVSHNGNILFLRDLYKIIFASMEWSFCYFDFFCLAWDARLDVSGAWNANTNIRASEWVARNCPSILLLNGLPMRWRWYELGVNPQSARVCLRATASIAILAKHKISCIKQQHHSAIIDSSRSSSSSRKRWLRRRKGCYPMACVCVLYLYHVLWLFSQRVSHRQRIVCVCENGTRGCNGKWDKAAGLSFSTLFLGVSLCCASYWCSSYINI